MKELTSNTGGRYLFFDDISDLQNSALASASALFFGKANCVLSGCTVSGNTVSEGYVWLEGKIRHVPQTSNLTFPVYIVSNNVTEQGMYLDSATQQDTAVTYGVRFTTVQSSGSIKFTSSGADVKVEDILFNGKKIESIDLDSINVGSATVSGGDIIYSNGKFTLMDGIITGTGEFRSDVSVSGHIQVGQGLRISSNKIQYMDDGPSITFSSVIISIDKPVTLGGNSIVIGGTTFSGDSIGTVISWGNSSITTTVPMKVASSTITPQVSVQDSIEEQNPTQKTLITSSSMLCYSASTQDYQANYSGLDMANGDAKLYIHGHPYNIGVSVNGFLYDKNNPNFVDPISGGGGSSSVVSVNNVDVINWKRSITDTTYTGVLEITSGGLRYNGSFIVDASLSVRQSATIGTLLTVPTIHAESVAIKNNGAYVSGIPGVVTIYNYTNIRFDVASGSSASTSIIHLVARRSTLTYIGGVLTANVTDQQDTILSRISVPHPTQLINQ